MSEAQNNQNVYGSDIWRLLIVHRTELVYPETVTTSYNEVRMQPSDEPGQAVLSSRMEIDPFEGVTGYLDYFGTRVASFDVHRPHRHLTVTATSTVETFLARDFGPGGYGDGRGRRGNAQLGAGWPNPTCRTASRSSSPPPS